MSGIVAWLRLDGAPAADDTFHRLVQGSAYHGADHSGTWSAGAIALAHHQLCTTSESEHEEQPIASSDENLRLTFDGRLDNRDELLAALSLRPSEPVSDAELVLRAYARWGLDCTLHLLGDYAFALWDARERRLFCARDPLGVRPVYYSVHAGSLAVTSGLRELASSGAMPRDVNEGMLGEYLTGNLYSVSDTLYRDAFRLPAGHRMTVDTHGLRITRFWHPEAVPELSITRPEAADRFRALLFEAVRCRTRSPRPVAAHLSGGLDSSSVASILGTLQASADLTQGFEAYTLTFPGLSCDETEYAQAVADRYTPPWQRVPATTLPAADYRDLAARYLDFPGYPNGTFSTPLLDRMRERGQRVVLTGMGGDDWLGPASPVARTLDLVARGQLATLKRELEGYPWPGVLSATARHLVARGLDRFSIRRPRNAVFRRRLPEWLTPDFVRRTNLVERISELPPVPRGWSWSRAQRLSITDAGIRLHPLEAEDRTCSDYQIEARHPFYDVRVVEFLLALPDPFCATQATHKLVLRQAMRGVLPEQIRRRQSKASFGHVFRESLGSDAVRQAFAALGNTSSPDWIDGRRARAALSEYLGGSSKGQLWSLWAAYGIDLWWRVLDQIPAEAPAPRVSGANGRRQLLAEEHGVQH